MVFCFTYVKTENNLTDPLLAKLQGIENSATGDMTASEILAALITVDGAGSGLDSDYVDGIAGPYIIQEGDSRLSDARTPIAHTHTESEITDLGNYEPAFTKNGAFNKDFGSTDGTVCEGNDSRLSNAREPTAHTHIAAEVSDFDTEVGNHIDVVANTNHRGDTDNPHGVDKSDVGLGNVANELQVIAKNGGKNLWVQSSEPTALEMGDIWIQTS